uniref:Uncharacterized protein n=1 Tax=Moniliophthora roreri TaxID=221103 RepID=A0A0W0FBT5_MONRR
MGLPAHAQSSSSRGRRSLAERGIKICIRKDIRVMKRPMAKIPDNSPSSLNTNASNNSKRSDRIYLTLHLHLPSPQPGSGSSATPVRVKDKAKYQPTLFPRCHLKRIIIDSLIKQLLDTNPASVPIATLLAVASSGVWASTTHTVSTQ